MDAGTGAVIVAAGTGSRMGSPVSKQFLPLAGKPIIVHTLELFQQLPEIDSIVLVVGAADVDRCRHEVERADFKKVTAIVAGGEERQHSVYAGLQALGDSIRWVAVHDGVRPFVRRSDVLACLRKATATDAAVLAVPVKDTIKVADAGVIRATLERQSLWSIQTPQAFRLSLLMQAYEVADRERFVGTDDATLVERLGCEVHIVPGDYANIKITTPEDLEWAEFRLKAKGESEVAT